MFDQTIQLINDLQIIGQDQNGIWVLGLVSLSIQGGRFKALYSEYKHGNESSYFTKEFNGKISQKNDVLCLEGFGKLLPHEGFSTIGELVITARAPYIRNLRTISMKSRKESPYLEIMLKKSCYLG